MINLQEIRQAVEPSRPERVRYASGVGPTAEDLQRYRDLLILSEKVSQTVDLMSIWWARGAARL